MFHARSVRQRAAVASLVILPLSLGSCESAEPAAEPPNTVIVGDVRVQSADELRVLDGIVRIEGSLLFTGQVGGRLEASNLVSVRDRLVVYLSSLDTLSFPQLSDVGELHILENSWLEQADFPQLAQVGHASSTNGSDLRAFDNARLQALTLPALRACEGEIAGDVSALSLPVLERAGGLSLRIPNRQIAAPALATLGSLTIASPAGEAPREVQFPALREAGNVQLSSVRVDSRSFPLLGRLDSLSIGRADERLESLTIGHADEQVLELPALSSLGHLRPCGFAAIHLPMVRTIETFASCDEEGLRELRLPRLESVAKSMWLRGASLMSVDLSALSHVEELVVVFSGLRELRLDQLLEARRLVVRSNSELRQIVAPKLAQVVRMDVELELSSLCPPTPLFPMLAAAQCERSPLFDR